MKFGILKAGEGYWVRIMTISIIALGTLAMAGWVFQQAGLIADKLPKSGYEMNASLAGAAPAPGTRVELLGAPDTSGAQVSLGTATVASVGRNSGLLRINAVSMNGVHEVGETFAIRGAGDVMPPGTPSVPGAMIATLGARPQIRALSPIDEQVLRLTLAGIVVLAGAYLAYWFAGRREKTVDFLIATDFEMKKVNWSTPREVMGSTWVVIAAAVLISASLFFFDFVFKTVFQSIGVLAG